MYDKVYRTIPISRVWLKISSSECSNLVIGVVIAGKKGETGGEPKSIVKGQGAPRDPWEAELCAKQMR